MTAAGRFAVTAGEDGTARVWDLAAEALVAPACHGGRVTALAALPDGQLVVSAGEDGCVFLWDPVEVRGAADRGAGRGPADRGEGRGAADRGEGPTGDGRWAVEETQRWG